MNFLSKEALSKLNTKRLLAYKKALLKTPAEIGCDVCGDDCGTQDPDAIKGTKSEPIWVETYANVREILNTREHVKR